MITKIKVWLGQNWPLLLVLCLAAFLRLYKLAEVPPSLHWDETALGYNAYSILKTGRDEYGHFFPLVFKSFGDYKPGLYVYLAVPFIALLGLTETAVRLPSALAGVATVWLLYLVVSRLFPQQKPWGFKIRRPLSLLASFSLAVSPWHLQFSRGAWESNVTLFFMLIGIYCFLRTTPSRMNWLYLSALGFAAVVLTYQGGKMMVPLIIFGLGLCFWRRLRSWPVKHLFLAALLLLLVSLPVLISAFAGGGGRLKVMSVFSYPRPAEEVNRIAQEGGVAPASFLFKLFHSEALFFTRSILGRYFNHFSGRFLFFEGDWSSARHSVPYAGVLYYLDFVFLLAGANWLIRQNSPSEKFVWYWLLVSPLPAAFSRDAVQSVRAINMVLPLMVIIGSGLYQVYFWLKNQKKIISGFCFLFLIFFYLWCFAYYLDQYYLHYPIQSSQYWQYGYKKVVNRIYPISQQYKRIVFTRKWGQPYIYWLFYTRYNPADYQKQARLIENPAGDVGWVERIDNLEFRNLYWPADRGLKKSLFVGTEYELPLLDIDPDQARVLEEIKFLNGKVAFRVVETY